MIQMMYFADTDHLAYHDRRNMFQNMYFTYVDYILLVLEENLLQI